MLKKSECNAIEAFTVLTEKKALYEKNESPPFCNNSK